jgi:predicted 2-oxoglutarate/Fe(II)-dependent dioxygenase YbiX
MKEVLEKIFISPLRSMLLFVSLALFVGVSTPAFFKYIESKSFNLVYDASARSIRNEESIRGVDKRLDKIDEKLEIIYGFLINKKK